MFGGAGGHFHVGKMLVTGQGEYTLCHLRMEAQCTQEHGFMYALYYKSSVC